MIAYLLVVFVRFTFQNQEMQDVVNDMCSTNKATVNNLGAFKNIGKFGKIIRKDF